MKFYFKYTLLIFLFLLHVFATSAQTVLDVSKVSMTVSDLDEAVKFYTEVLPFEKEADFELRGGKVERLFGLQDTSLRVRVARLRLGGEYIELMQFHSLQFPARPIPEDSRSNDLWFQHIAIVVSDMPLAYQHLWVHEVTHVSTAPQTLPDYLSAAAGISAFYFRDPDGHNLELIHFPKGKGNPRWQTADGALFLGIDHSAIGIGSTRKSLAFYRDLMGMSVAGYSENYGTEQEHLNQVFGARLLITGLAGVAGIGLEFLDYIAPPGGRAYPEDSRPTDLWHWHTALRVTDVEKEYKHALQSNAKLISSGLVKFNHVEWGIKKGFLLRDPDGHAVFLYE